MGRPVSQIMIDYPDMVISQSDALQLGFIVYRTGEPCKRGHTGWRRTASTQCIECAKEALGKSPEEKKPDISQQLEVAREARKKAVLAEKRLLKRAEVGKKLSKKGDRDKEQKKRNSRLMKYQPNTILSREDAIKQGLGVFRTGNPCDRGHHGWQYVMNLLCVTCVEQMQPGALRKQYQNFRR